MTVDCCPVGWFVIEPAHSVFAGHFPGRPIVPGVVLLEQVTAQAREWHGQPHASLTRIPWAKFLAPVLPGQPVLTTLEAMDDGQIRFVCRVGAARVAEGLLVLASPSAP